MLPFLWVPQILDVPRRCPTVGNAASEARHRPAFASVSGLSWDAGPGLVTLTPSTLITSSLSIVSHHSNIVVEWPLVIIVSIESVEKGEKCVFVTSPGVHLTHQR